MKESLFFLWLLCEELYLFITWRVISLLREELCLPAANERITFLPMAITWRVIPLYFPARRVIPLSSSSKSYTSSFQYEEIHFQRLAHSTFSRPKICFHTIRLTPFSIMIFSWNIYKTRNQRILPYFKIYKTRNNTQSIFLLILIIHIFMHTRRHLSILILN